VFKDTALFQQNILAYWLTSSFASVMSALAMWANTELAEKFALEKSRPAFERGLFALKKLEEAKCEMPPSKSLQLIGFAGG
jgi:hypothetical protein